MRTKMRLRKIKNVFDSLKKVQQIVKHDIDSSYQQYFDDELFSLIVETIFGVAAARRRHRQKTHQMKMVEKDASMVMMTRRWRWRKRKRRKKTTRVFAVVDVVVGVVMFQEIQMTCKVNHYS